jgi:peptidoglycan-associated lipoprotein
VASEFSLWPQMPIDLLQVRRRFGGLLIAALVVSALLFSGCPNKTVTQAPPPPPPPTPTANIEVSAATVQLGQSVTVSWKTENAEEVTIEHIGPVAATGSVDVAPTESTTYKLTAKGPGGVQEATTRVTLESSTVEATKITESQLDAVVQSGNLDIYFDTNEFLIRDDQRSTIKNDADFLKQYPGIHITVEGHCDDVGSIEYNIVLGEMRAGQVKAALEREGISSGRIKTFSWGKERPFCQEETAACMQLNRRAHIVTQVD